MRCGEPSYVYFIKPVGMDGPIKIGWSCKPESRLQQLSTWSPFELELITVIPGSSTLEQNIHECFADLHSHREWFRAGERLLTAIERIKAGIPINEAIDLSARLWTLRVKQRGAAAWSPGTKRRVALETRVRCAVRRIGWWACCDAPENIRSIIKVSQDRDLTQPERDVLDAFCSNPERFMKRNVRKAS